MARSVGGHGKGGGIKKALFGKAYAEYAVALHIHQALVVVEQAVFDGCTLSVVCVLEARLFRWGPQHISCTYFDIQVWSSMHGVWLADSTYYWLVCISMPTLLNQRVISESSLRPVRKKANSKQSPRTVLVAGSLLKSPG